MKKYRNTGLKLTPQRIAILNYLEGNKEHPSAEDIYKAISERFPTMSFSTVYNTLETLKQKAMLWELTIDADKKRFDPNTAHHNHLICITCKRIVDIHSKYELEVDDNNKKGFQIIGSHVEFYGICSECRKHDVREGKDEV